MPDEAPERKWSCDVRRFIILKSTTILWDTMAWQLAIFASLSG